MREEVEVVGSEWELSLVHEQMPSGLIQRGEINGKVDGTEEAIQVGECFLYQGGWLLGRLWKVHEVEAGWTAGSEVQQEGSEVSSGSAPIDFERFRAA